MFSRDEKFFGNEKIETINDAELYRNNKQKIDSQIRLISSFFEICVYSTLNKFFEKLKEFKGILNMKNSRLYLILFALKN